MEKILVRKVIFFRFEIINLFFKANERRCWTRSRQGCENHKINLTDLTPAEDVRLLVTDFKGGGTKYKEQENNKTEEENQECSADVVSSSDGLVEEVKCKGSNLRQRFESFKAAGLVSQAGTLKSLAKRDKKVSRDSAQNKNSADEEKNVVKSDNGAAAGNTRDVTSQDEEEEYSEISNTKSSDIEAVTSQEEEEEEEEEYNECEGVGLSVKVERSEECSLCQSSGHDSGSCPQLQCKACGGSGHAIFSCPDNFSAPNSVESNFSGELDPRASPKKEAGLSTPTSSGYWSDDAKEGPYFGKITWINEEKTVGYIEVVLDIGETNHVHVSGYDVKCGAETGDLVEFVLGIDVHHGRAAKRVKLVEKGLPVSEEDQIKGQSSLKRSLEISAGWVGDKRIRTEEVIHVRADAMSDYSDIADGDHDVPMFKLEDNEETSTEELHDHCICDKRILSRCQFCPFFFLEAVTGHSLLEGESVTFLAKIQGNEGSFKKKLEFIRQIRYPFRYLTQSKFSFLKEIGRKSIVPKISSVFKQDFAFVTIENSKSSQISLRPGDIVGICQSAETSSSQVSDHFMFEPPSRQNQRNIPVFIKKSDFNCDDNNAHCGFGSLGGGKMNYKYCLVKVTLRSDLQKKLKLVKSELTVQISRNVWLELECGKGVFERANIGKDGCIGFATSIMDLKGVEEILSLSSRTKQSSEVRTVAESFLTDEKVETNAYDEMLNQIDKDMTSSVPAANRQNMSIDYLLARTYKATVGENILVIPPRGEIEANLYLQDDDHSLDLKRLLKFRATVTSNDAFKYFNNCFEIEEQSLTIVNGICRASRSTKPCVKVKITNPRNEDTYLKKNSPLALVKIKLGLDKNKTSAPSAANSTEKTLVPEAPDRSIVDGPHHPPQVSTQDNFKPEKYFQKSQRTFTRKWDILCAESTFQKSLLVEKKYPYFINKPKVPFGLKDMPDLNMRVGIDQDSKPVKVLDKINGVFTCTICDVVILDKYSLQDHWYSPKHKEKMKMVQIIAGPEERLAMNRPVVQEMFDQFNLCPLLGLEHIIEIIKAPENSRYYCSLCSSYMHVSELVLHLTSLKHNLSFIKKYFPVAWQRFSVIPDFNTWMKMDFQCLDVVIEKIDQVHGRKRPVIVADSSKFEEIIQKVACNAYSARRTELDTYFKRLKPAEERQGSTVRGLAVPVTKDEKKIESKIAIISETTEVGANSTVGVIVKILDIPKNVKPGRFLKVTKNPAFTGSLDIKPGFSRVWEESSEMLIKVTVENCESTPITILQGSEISVVTA